MYSWNIDDLKKLLRYYLVKIKETSNPQLIVDYQNTINSIHTLLDYYKEQTTRKVSFEIVRLKDIIEEDLYYLDSFREYMPLVKDFRNSFDSHTIQIDRTLPKINISNNHIVSLSKNFYRKFQGVFSETYEKLASNFQNKLWFRDCKKSMSYGGNTYGIYGTDDVYIEVFKNKTIQDAITFLHEGGHGISSIINPKMKWDYKKYCFIETETLFFEILATFYLGVKLNRPDECSQIRISTFNDYLYSAELLCAKEELYTNFKDLNRRKIIKFYKTELGYNKKVIKDAIDFQVNENLHYVISYLTAIELFLIYLTDPAVALNLLYKIILLDNLESDEYLMKVRELGIDLGRNVKKFYELISNEREGLKYEKKI